MYKPTNITARHHLLAKHPDVERLSQTTDRLNQAPTCMYIYIYIYTQYVHIYIYILCLLDSRNPFLSPYLNIIQPLGVCWVHIPSFYGLDFRRIKNVDKDLSGYVNMCVSVFLDKIDNHVRSVSHPVCRLATHQFACGINAAAIRC